MSIAPLFLTLLLFAPPADRERGYIGISPAPLNDETRSMLQVDKSIRSGLILVDVFPNTAAARAGLRKGDVLVQFDKRAVKSTQDLMTALEGKGPGTKVAYVARRGSGTISGILILGKAPKQDEAAVAPPHPLRKGEVRAVPAAKLDDVTEREIEMRMKALQKEIELLNAEAKKKLMQRDRVREEAMKKSNRRTKGAPKNWAQWMEREERALKEAEKARNVERAIWHRARAELLRELKQTGAMGATAKKKKATPVDKRVARVERKLAEVMDRLARLEKRMK
ncbi:MAG: PDZ domain-containing protein [Planctomycetota bacterium]